MLPVKVLGDLAAPGVRFTYQINLLIFGLASLAAGFAPDMTTLVRLRFVMGLGLGAEIVVGYATLTEFVPTRHRSTVSLYQPTWQDAVVALDSGAALSRQGNQEGLPMKSTLSRDIQTRGLVLILLVVLLLIGLPLVVWLDLKNLTEANLRRQAGDLNSVVSSVRNYYASNVVGRILASPGSAQVTQRVAHNYESISGAIPIPATLSLELGQVISEQQQNITYRFVSDYPFANRTPHVLDDFEKSSLAALRVNPGQQLADVSWSAFADRVRLIVPVVMGAACVNCHNAHPESPKHDWKVGDVRGIQEVIITQATASNIFSFKYLLTYFALMAACGTTFIGWQRRQAATIKGMNGELETANEFLASLSMKISRYLSPQIYKSIFSGQKDVTIHTERKKLTIFFSDIKDFTATPERLQPEQTTQLLNEYFTEMSAIALRHGGTVDKFVGDAMLIFFGDPESKGEVEDAKACMRMALDMQQRLGELNIKWRNNGMQHPFGVRMGINTGFCNVGNFGSADRMDYTIIGAEANLAARLQSIAEPGHIVLSYETYMLVRDLVVAQAQPPIMMKGISREIIPYAVRGTLGAAGEEIEIFREHMAGLDLYLNPSMISTHHAEHIRTVLQEALRALDRNGPRSAAASIDTRRYPTDSADMQKHAS